MARPLVSDALWELIEPLIPKVERRYRHPGRKRIDDRKVLTGILFVATYGDPVGVPAAGAGLRLGDDLLAAVEGVAGVGCLTAVHELPLAKLNEAELIDWSRAAIDSSHVRAFGSAPRPAPARSTAPGAAPSIT